MKCSLAFLFILLPFCMCAKEGIAPSNLQSRPGGTSLSFIENKGQIIDQNGKHRNDIDFKLEAGGMTMFIGSAAIHYQWVRQQGVSSANIPLPSASPFKGGIGAVPPLKGAEGDVHSTPVDIYRLDVELIGANKNPQVITEELQEYTENYYLPQCPDGATAHSYKKITYRNVYPNIDWVVYIKSKGNPDSYWDENQKEESITNHKSEITNGIKYDFVVKPGGNYADIKLQYKGATKLELKGGALIATTPLGSISEDAPYTYYAASKKEIASGFILNGDVLSYNINHDKASLSFGKGQGDIIIDPSLSWGTYYGGSGVDEGGSLGTDTAGNIYMGGATKSNSNIATTGAHQTSLNGDYDLFLVKFNIAGVRQWATYYGGSWEEPFARLATDNSGNIYLAGRTNASSGIATTGAHQAVFGGGIPNPSYPPDGFLVKFNNSGSRIWATYYGDTSGESVEALACDAAGNIYIGGNTGSIASIATAGAYQTTPASGFFAKFSSSGVRQWGSYYPAIVSSICADNAGNLFIAGRTGAMTGIATTGAHQTISGGGLNEGFIAKFNSSQARLWGTYYGGAGHDDIMSMDCDGAGNLYIAGSTRSTTGIASTGSFQPSLAGANNGFIAKFNPSGVRQWGTYYGGTNIDYICGIDAGADGNLYIAGDASSNSGIATPGSYQTTRLGSGDAFFAVFNNAGNRLYATYYGGTGSETLNSGGSYNYNWAGGSSLAFCDNKGKIFFAGTTGGSSFGIATTGAHQSVSGGSDEAFLVEFDADTSVFLILPIADSFKCAGDSLHVPYGVTQNFRSTNTFTLQLSSASGSFASPTTLATVSGGARGTFHTIVPLSITTGSGYRIRVLGSAPADTSEDNGVDLRYAQYPATPLASANTPLCSGNTLNLSATGTATAVWGWSGPGSFTANTQNINITNAQTTHSGNYIVTANLNNGCIRKDTVTVVINQTPAKPNAGSNSPLCSGNTLNLTSSSTTSGVSWNWTGPMGFGSTNQNPSIPNVQTNQAGDYIVTATLGPCSSKDTTTVTVNPGPTINTYVNPKDTICAGGTVTLVALVTNGGSGPSYQWYKNGNPIGGATSANYLASGLNNGDVFYCQFTPGTGTGCNGTINSSSITITVLPITNPSINITASPDTNIWQGLNVTFTATATTCSKPTYQWKLNSNNVNGATSNTWGAATLADNDQVSCVMTCNDPCPNPKDATSNKLTIHVAANAEALGVSVYPNPFRDELIIETPSPYMERAGVRLFDVLGREVFSGIINNAKQSVNTSALASGTYVLQLTSSTGERVMYKVVKE